MNLLVVDDNPAQLASLRVALKTKGHRVLTAESGKDALAELDRQASIINLVLTDYAMPEMDGLELLSTIRQKSQAIPVIMMTGHSDKHLISRAFQNGCTGFLDKPFTLEQLTTEIRRIEQMKLQKNHTEMLLEKIPELINLANDKLTVIAGNAEIALLDLGSKNLESLKNQLMVITAFSEEIGAINGKIMRLIFDANEALVRKKGDQEK